MKKLLFAAALAIVAVGGAYAQQYSTLPNSGGTKFSCVGSGPSCAANAPRLTDVYLIDSETEVDIPENQYPLGYQAF